MYRKIVKRTLLFLIAIHVSLFGLASTYYVSNSGSDSNPGTEAQPWQTLSKVNVTTFSPGDQILFNRGETFYGNLIVSSSGTSGNPIIFGAYGTGGDPIITGFTTVTAWTNLGSNIWESTGTVSSLSTCEVVTINGVQVAMGRTPNDDGTINKSNWYWITSHSGTTSVTSSDLIGTPDWTGATFVTKTTSYTCERATVSSQSGSTLTLNSGMLNQPFDNNGFFIQNSPSTLDTQNEWYYNPTTHKIRVYSPSEPTNVKVASIDNLITINASHVTVDNLTITGANKDAIYSSGSETYKTVQNCTISFCGENGTYLRGAHSKVYNCEISYCNNNGYYNINAVRCIVRKCNVHDCGTVLGGSAVYGGYNGILATGTGNLATLIDSCTVTNIGLNGISTMGDSVIIKNNYVNEFNIHLSDGGGIYVYGVSPTYPIYVIGNIVLNGGETGSANWGTFYDNLPYGESHGIYCDNAAVNHVLWGNTISNVKNGINCAYVKDMDIEYNTIYKTFLTSLYIWGGSLTGYTNNFIKYNMFVQTIPQYPDFMATLNGYTDRVAAKDLAVYDYNVYARPTDDYSTYNWTTVKPIDVTLDGVHTYMSFDEWKTYSGQDTHSTKSLFQISSSADMRFEYNASNSPKTVTLTYPMVDVTGKKYANSVTLQPYTSVVLIKDPNPVSSVSSTEYKSICEGTSYNGWTTSGTYERTLTAASGADSIVTTYLTVNPTYTITKDITIQAGETYNDWSETGTYTETFSSVTGCDSTVVTNLTVTSQATVTAPATVSSTEYKSICDGTSYNGWTTSGTYERTLTAVSGADSIVTTYLTVNPTYTITKDTTIQTGETYNGWSETGTYTETFSSVTGCDSTVITNLTVDSLVTKQGEILPTHFIPVWQGENGQNHMNVMVVSATVDDMLLAPDDEIALFSGTLCVGSVRLSQPLDSMDNSTFVNILASQDDGSGNGFTDNDTIVVKVWDSVNQREMDVQKVKYLSDVSTWLTTGKYSAGATSAIKMKSYTEYTQTISLLKGYNMMSTYVTADDPNVSVVTKPLTDEGTLVKVQDETGTSYENWGSFGGWVNNLGDMKRTEGYKIEVESNCSLTVKGRPVALPLDIPLNIGWNIISFPHSNQVDAMSVIQPLIDQNVLIKVQDETGNSIEDWGAFGGWINGIGNFVPGKAYKVKVNASAVLTIQENYTKSAVLTIEKQPTLHFSTSYDGNGVDHMNINLVDLNQIGVSVGDEIAAFDGDLCVGAIKLTSENLTSGTASLIASAPTDDQNSNGFKSGDPIQIKVWSQNSGSEILTQVELASSNDEQNLNFTKNASIWVSLKSSGTETNNVLGFVTVDVYPNPCKDKFSVRFSSLPEYGSAISIFDSFGRQITTREIENTVEVFDLENLAAGLYLIKTHFVEGGDQVQKLIVSR